jgi:GNAT superfamily N-acetyltransferase
LYLEDIIVTESERGKGLGKLLFDATLKHTHEADCTGMTWQVLDWNEPAIQFYKKYDCQMGQDWINCSLERDRIEEILKTK